MTTRRWIRRGGVLIALALLGAMGWLYGTSTGQRWRLARMATADLLAHTLANPRDLEAHRLLGDRLMREGRAEEAIPVFREAVLAKPGAVWNSVELGRAQIQAGRAQEAVDSLSNALRQTPQNADIQAALGEAFSALQVWEAAEQNYRAALQSEPSHALALAGLAILQADRRNLAGARETLRRIPPGTRAAYIAQGYIEDRGGNSSGALESYARAVATDPQDARAARLLAAARVRAARTTEDFRQAEDALAQAAKLNPNWPFVPYQRGLLLAKQEQHSQAAEAFQRALALDPGYLDALYNLSLSLAFMGQEKESARVRAEFERASDYNREKNSLRLRLSRDPENAPLWRRLTNLAEANQDAKTAQWARSRLDALPH